MVFLEDKNLDMRRYNAPTLCTEVAAIFVARNISYSDIPQYYVFDKSTTNWKKRQRGGQNVIGRLPVVSILDTERYYLRMLLLRKSGAISFDDILTVNGLRCITFQQACQEYGLLRGDQQWHDALNDAAQFQPSRQLRMLFAMICGFGEVFRTIYVFIEQDLLNLFLW
ncbi:hypothetical protein AVEN_256127-1 [Araneus ventricosus]|uniref:Uncharacterized protein n=1 Tax=Araneus ventricosus TaxID=182803 RepID=A0A4Y2D7I3_ARAVE|nr:hypothetical protein AVEN_256127-1 [Araneus ventricosus]